MTRYTLLGLALVALSACQADETALDTDVPPDISTKAGCEANGGAWGPVGLLLTETCTMPTPDAGKACSVESDCTGMCMAGPNTCSTITPLFGCHVFLDDAGDQYEICID